MHKFDLERYINAPVSTTLQATRGKKFFELSNHLGNVLTTITDQKLWRTEGGSSYYVSTVKSVSDYYPFGLSIAGRNKSENEYRFGFNGKENDESWGDGVVQDYGFRVYSPNISRFFSVDPIMASYPWYTPYQFAGNMPITSIDLDGLEELKVTGRAITFEPKLTLKSQWINTDRECACRTFAEAAKYNTEHLNNSVYEPVRQIHKYYVWAGNEIDKTNSNIKFFHAAAEVTSYFGVGGAYIAPEWITGLSDHGRKSLADVNAKLIKENISVVKEILSTGKSSLFKGKKGILWDFEYVNREQNFLTDVIKADPLSQNDKDAINDNFEKFEGFHPEYVLAKKLLGVDKLDYEPQRQRMAIGRALVFMLHMGREGFDRSVEYEQGILFLRKEYGDENVKEFLKKYRKDNDPKPSDGD